MNPQHHLDEATLMRYASGDLDEAFLVVVATHLAMCSECRKAVALAEEIGGEILSMQPDIPLPKHAFDALLDKIDHGASATLQQAPPEQRSEKQTLPQPLRRYLGTSEENIAWKKIAPGVQKHALKTRENCDSLLYLLQIAPGKKVPEHGHGGAEMTLILAGAYRDEFGYFGPGDIADLDEHVEHQPVVEPQEPCICLVATETLTRFKGVFSRMLQPLVGI